MESQQLSLFLDKSLTLSTITKAKNFRIAEDIGQGGTKTKAANNLKAIRLSKILNAEQRSPTVEEQAILAQYLGWGVAPEVFEEPLKPDWQAMGTELRELLSSAEYRAARASIVNAYYTTPLLICEIYRGVSRLGFRGGRILEPSLGSGLWLGLVPEEVSDRCQWTGVELDPTSGHIAQQLYPEAEINVRGFEEVLLPDNYFDLALGNVPFSAIAPNDPLFPKWIKTLHDYFFVKALRLVRPGGLLVFITSVGTLQSKKSRAVRELLSESADLVGAMRFPSTAFQQFTNTQVTTDLVILQKREHPKLEPRSLDWLEVVESGLSSDEGKPLSLPLYYQQHPEMLLGKLCVDKLYGGGNRLGLASDGRDLRQAITEAFSYLPEGIYKDVTLSQQRQLFKTKSMLIPPELQGQLKPFNYVWYDNSPWQAKNGRLEPVVADGIPRMRLYWLIQVRVAVKEVFLVGENRRFVQPGATPA